MRYSVTPDDALEFAKYHMFWSPRGHRNTRLFRLFIFAFMSLSSILLMRSDQHNAAHPLPIAISVAVALIMGLLAYRIIAPDLIMGAFVRRIVRRQLSAGGDKYLGEQTIEAGPAGLILTTRITETQFAWDSLERVVTDQDRTYLYVTAANAIVIPHAGIVEGDIAEFLAAVKTNFAPIVLGRVSG